jgi:hypothetical protein
MPGDFRDALIYGIVAAILLLCVQLWERLWERLKGRPIRTYSIRPALFAEVGIVLLFVGVGFLTAIAAGVIQSSPALSAVIIATFAMAAVCFVYSVLLLLLYVPLPRRRQRKSVEDSDV